MGEDPAWLARLPAGGVFVAGAGTLALVAAALRAAAGSTRAGRRAVRFLHGLEATVVATLLAAMLVLSFLQIVLRNVLHTGLVWVDPLLRHLLLWIGFAGAALATRVDRHISVDALTRLLRPGSRRAAHAATCTAAAIVCLLLAEACLEFVRGEAAAGTRGFLDVPTWRVQMVMPAALLVMCYRFLRRAIESARGIEPVESPLFGEAPR